MKISTKNQRGRRKRKEVEVGTKEFTNGRGSSYYMNLYGGSLQGFRDGHPPCISG